MRTSNFYLSEVVKKIEGLKSTDKKRQVVYDGTITPTNGQSIDVASDNYALLEVSRIIAGQGFNEITPQVSTDGINWKSANVTNINTGSVFKMVTTPGKYLIDVSAYKKVRFKVNMTSGGRGITAHLITTDIKPDITPNDFVDRTHKTPSPLRPPYEITKGSERTTSVSKNGNLYGVSGNRVRKSVNKGSNWSTLFNFGDIGQGVINRAAKLDSGHVLAFVNVLSSPDHPEAPIQTIWRSDENEENFEEVFRFEVPNVQVSNGDFGYHQCKNVVVCSEYNPKDINSDGETARRAYISKDYGKTFRKVFERPVVEGDHIHDIHFDPYESIIWIVAGDTATGSETYWTKDWGDTWNSVYNDEGSPVCFTQVIALPNCVLFGSDAGRTAFYRWHRVKGGIESLENIDIELAHVDRRVQPDGIPFMVDTAIDYDNHVVYCGWQYTRSSSTKPAALYATSDGHNFYKVWESEEIPDRGGVSGVVGIGGVYGPTEDGYLTIYYRHRFDEGQHNNVKIKVPDWN